MFCAMATLGFGIAGVTKYRHWRRRGTAWSRWICAATVAVSRPAGVENYSFDKTSADVLAVLDHFNEQQAVVFGHDFGANLAWHLAVHHADRVRAMASLCVPYEMPLAGGSDVRPSSLYAQIAQAHFFHMHYYQREGVPERSTVGREREFLAKLFWALCADGDLLGWENFPPDAHYVDVLSAPASEPPWPWLSLEDFDYYVTEYLRAGPCANFYRRNQFLSRDGS